MIEPTPEAIKLITYLNRGGAWGYYWTSSDKLPVRRI